jgi:hypothetical protein
MAKKDNKIIEDEMKKDAITMESSSSNYGFFDNKFVRAGLATALAVYASKKEPYMLKSFAEKMEEFEKYDRETRAKFVEAATASATTEIAKNKLRRLQRREKIAPEIKKAVENGMNPIIAGKAYKAGHLPTLMKLKLKDASLNLNTFYNVADQYKDTIGGFSETDVIEALAGPTLKLDNAFNNLKAPRTISPIRNFLGGGDDGSAQKEIQQRIDSQTTSSDDYKPIDYSGIEVSDLGTRALASMQKVRNITATQIKSDFTRSLSNALGINSDYLNGSYIFDSDDKINEGYGGAIQREMSKEVEDLITKQFMSPANAQKQVFDKYLNTTKDGVKLDMGVVGPDGLKILPKGWTPSKSKGSNTGTGSGKGGNVTLSSIKADWLKKKAALLKRFGNNRGNIKYKAEIDKQGASIRKQYKVLKGDPNDIDLSY